jgi:hypothetical protein
MPYEVCRHIKVNGRRCQAPAVRGEVWCFFHDRHHTAHGKIRRFKSPYRIPGAPPVNIPALEDRDAVQLGISLVVTALESDLIDDNRARTLFRGLELAAKNLSGTTPPLLTSELPMNSFIPTEHGNAIAQQRLSNDPHLNEPSHLDRPFPMQGLHPETRGGFLSPPPTPSDDDVVL